MESKEPIDVIKDIEEQLEREEAIRIINEARSNKARSNKVSNSINKARNLSTKDYKKEVLKNERNKNKRTITGPKVFEKAKKFVAVGITVLMLFLAVKVGGILKNYKDEAYNDALNAVKSEIAEDLENVGPEEIQMFDNSSKIDESTNKEEYVLKIGDEEFRDKTISGNGSTVTEFNQIGDSNITDAIRIVANAKNGSWSDAKKARELVEEIKSGKVELNFATNYKLRELSKQDKTR